MDLIFLFSLQWREILILAPSLQTNVYRTNGAKKGFKYNKNSYKSKNHNKFLLLPDKYADMNSTAFLPKNKVFISSIKNSCSRINNGFSHFWKLSQETFVK